MRIFYQGCDITELAAASRCVCRDTAGSRCDSLEIEFENAAGWHRWGPQEDDKIRVTHNGYDTGTLYVHTVLPEGGRYRIFATALPCAAREKRWESFAGKSLKEIVAACAARSGMGWSLYGIDGDVEIPYFEMQYESCASALHRLLTPEGAQLKCVNGRYAAISVLWAQERQVLRRLEIEADEPGVEWRRSGQVWRRLILDSPWARGVAEDPGAGEDHGILWTGGYPARNGVQAARWARGLLLMENRQSETLTLSTEFDPGFTAMTGIEVSGAAEIDGKWLIQEAEHDFTGLRSRAVLRRYRTGIY